MPPLKILFPLSTRWKKKMSKRGLKFTFELEGKAGAVLTLPQFRKPFQGVCRATSGQADNDLRQRRASWLRGDPPGDSPARHGQPSRRPELPARGSSATAAAATAAAPPSPAPSFAELQIPSGPGHCDEAGGLTSGVPWPAQAQRPLFPTRPPFPPGRPWPQQLPTAAGSSASHTHRPPRSQQPSPSRTSPAATASPQGRTPVPAPAQRGTACGSFPSRTRGQGIGCRRRQSHVLRQGGAKCCAPAARPAARAQGESLQGRARAPAGPSLLH